jgi:hypothetical protein
MKEKAKNSTSNNNRVAAENKKTATKQSTECIGLRELTTKNEEIRIKKRII